jgi:hypothetical protein
MWAFQAFAGTSFMSLRIPVVSMDFRISALFWFLPSSTDELGSFAPIHGTRCDPLFVSSRQHELKTMKGHVFPRNQFFSPFFLASQTFQ